MFEEYEGKISSMVVVDELGNPTSMATVNDVLNAFNVKINVQFFNLIPDVPYRYLLEVDAATILDKNESISAEMPEHSIVDSQLKAKTGTIVLNSSNLSQNTKISKNGYLASTTLNIDDIPIFRDAPETYKVKIHFKALTNKPQHTWQESETFVSIPGNAYRPGLGMPHVVPAFPSDQN